MKKFFKLCLAVAALATMFGFASCSNDSSNDATAPAATKEVSVKTRTVKIGETEYVYTETDGKADATDKVKVGEDGSITVTTADGSKVTLSKDGKTITYTDKNGKVYTGQLGGESITLKSSDGTEVTASAAEKTEKKTVPTTTPAATGTVSEAKMTVTELTFTDSQLADKIFKFQNNGDSGKLEDRYYLFHGGKCYKDDSVEGVKYKVGKYAESDWRTITIIKVGDKLLQGSKATRASGEGLFAKWTTNDGDSMTLKADGTGTMVVHGESVALTFTNDGGLVTLKVTEKNQTMPGYYDGTYLYQAADKNVLHFVENYTASN